MTEAVLALGSNLGDSAATLRGAVAALASMPGIDIVAMSGMVETDPVGGPDQDVYLNAVIVVRTTMTSSELLAAAHAVEQSFDRVREVRWGPRTLDVDIVVFGSVVSADPDLTLPHPRAHERGFVLVPWLDADPDAVLPGHGRVADLVRAIDTSGVRATSLTLSSSVEASS